MRKRKKVHTGNIPQKLKDLDQWVGWRNEKDRDGKPTKVPINCSDGMLRNAKSNDPTTWTSFEKAVRMVQKHELDGIGFMISKNDPYVGIDLDSCMNKKTGKIKKYAQDIVDALNSYTEISPSGRGLHIFVRGILPEGSRKGTKLEVYEKGRYLTVTGRHLDGTPTAIKLRKKELFKICEEFFPPKSSKSQEVTPFKNNPTDHLSDKQIIKQAKKAENGKKFKRLWKVKIGGYKSQSEADIALCQMIHFWTGPENARIDRIFRKSGLHRRKWDEKHSSDGKTYGEITVQKAIRTNKVVCSNTNEIDLRKIIEEAEFFQSSLGEAYATVRVDGHFETVLTRSFYFKHWLRYTYRSVTGKVCPKEQIETAIEEAISETIFNGTVQDPNVRVARLDDAIYWDLANDHREVIKITSKKWKIVRHYPVKFIRPPGMQPLPFPKKNGQIKDIFPFLNAQSHSSRVMFISWLLGTFNPVGSLAIMLLMGEQGSAKTTTSRVLKAIIDPSEPSLKSLPRSERDLAVMATKSWIIGMDNISMLQQWSSDALCRIASGAGFSTRTPYTDRDESLFSIKRPIIINGIDVQAHFSDFKDRCINQTLPRVRRRMPESTFWEKFSIALPSIMGGLCNAVSMGLNNRKMEVLDDLPRMADFAKWVISAEPALPWTSGQFLEIYRKNIARSVETSIEQDPVSTAILEMMRTRKEWSGTATQLLEGLEGNEKKARIGVVSERTTRSKAWPKTPSAFSHRLHRAVTILRDVGIRVKFEKESVRGRIISIKNLRIGRRGGKK